MSNRDDLKRKREREDETDTEISKRLGWKTPEQSAKETASGASPEKFLEMLERAEPLIEQVNSLYNQYIAGVERLPPLERRSQLDQLIAVLTLMPKMSPAHQFRFRSIQDQYIAYRDRWERLLKGLEDGTIKRR